MRLLRVLSSAKSGLQPLLLPLESNNHPMERKGCGSGPFIAGYSHHPHGHTAWSFRWSAWVRASSRLPGADQGKDLTFFIWNYLSTFIYTGTSTLVNRTVAWLPFFHGKIARYLGTVPIPCSVAETQQKSRIMFEFKRSQTSGKRLLEGRYSWLIALPWWKVTNFCRFSTNQHQVKKN